MDETRRGTITALWAEGGIMLIFIRDSAGKSHRIAGDSGPTGRALIALFGPQVVSGMSIDAGQIIGQEVSFGVDEDGQTYLVGAGDES